MADNLQIATIYNCKPDAPEVTMYGLPSERTLFGPRVKFSRALSTACGRTMCLLATIDVVAARILWS